VFIEKLTSQQIYNTTTTITTTTITTTTIPTTTTTTTTTNDNNNKGLTKNILRVGQKTVLLQTCHKYANYAP